MGQPDGYVGHKKQKGFPSSKLRDSIRSTYLCLGVDENTFARRIPDGYQPKVLTPEELECKKHLVPKPLISC